MMETRVMLAWVVDQQDWETGFAQMLEGEGCRENTVAAYVQDLRVFVGWWEQETGEVFSAGSLTKWEVQQFRRWQLDVVRVKASTWNRRRVALMRFTRWGMEQGWLRMDPMEGTRPMEVEELPPNWLGRGVYARFMRQVEKEINTANTEKRQRLAVRDAALVALMAYAGMREGDVVALRCADLEMSERKGRVLIRQGKGGKEAWLPLNREARRLVGAWLVCTTGEGLLFEGLSARGVQKRIARLGSLAGLGRVTPHRLRHTFGKRLDDAGESLPKIQKLMRHKNIQTTMRYTQAGWDDLEEAVERL